MQEKQICQLMGVIFFGIVVLILKRYEMKGVLKSLSFYLPLTLCRSHTKTHKHTQTGSEIQT